MYQGRRVFRLGWGFTLTYVGLTALFAAGAVMTYRDRGWTWVSIGLAAAAVILGGGSILETFIFRIELADDAMIVTDWSGRKRYPIDAIDRVAEAKGSPAILLLKDGRRVRLPSCASSLGNSVRRWLKR